MEEQLIKKIPNAKLFEVIEYHGMDNYFLEVLKVEDILHPELQDVVEKLRECYERIDEILESEGIN